MAVSHWWFGVLIDDREHELFEPRFTSASARAVLSADSRATLETWRRDPSAFDDFGSASEDQVNSFIWAFNLPSSLASSSRAPSRATSRKSALPASFRSGSERL